MVEIGFYKIPKTMNAGDIEKEIDRLYFLLCGDDNDGQDG